MGKAAIFKGYLGNLHRQARQGDSREESFYQALKEIWKQDYDILWDLRKFYHTRRNTWNGIFLTKKIGVAKKIGVGPRKDNEWQIVAPNMVAQ